MAMARRLIVQVNMLVDFGRAFATGQDIFRLVIVNLRVWIAALKNIFTTGFIGGE